MSPLSKDDVVLLCMPLGRGPVAAGSLQKQCTVCGQGITVSRASLFAAVTQAAATKQDCKFVCCDCAPSVVPPDSELMPITEGQREEIRAELERLRDAQ